MSLIMRYQWEAYLECLRQALPGYFLMGEGFTDLTESKNAKEYSRKYVKDKNERTDVVGYASSIGYSADVYDDDPVVQEVIAVSDEELIGSEAQRYIVSVNRWQSVAANTFVAYRKKYAIIPDGKGEGTDALIYSGNFKAVGENEKGTFNVLTRKFNATAAATLNFTCSAGSSAGHTAVGTIDPALTAGNSYVYKTDDAAITLPNAGDILDHTWAPWDGSSDIEAVSGDYLAIVEISPLSACVAAGIGTVVTPA